MTDTSETSGHGTGPHPSGFTCWWANGWTGCPAQSSAPCLGSWLGCGDGRLSGPRCPSPSSPWSWAHVGPTAGDKVDRGVLTGPSGRASCPVTSVSAWPGSGATSSHRLLSGELCNWDRAPLPVRKAGLAYIQKHRPQNNPRGSYYVPRKLETWDNPVWHRATARKTSCLLSLCSLLRANFLILLLLLKESRLSEIICWLSSRMSGELYSNTKRGLAEQGLTREIQKPAGLCSV